MQPHEPIEKAREVLFSMLGTPDLSPDAILVAASRLSIPYVFTAIKNWEEHDSGPGVYDKLEIFDLMFQGKSLPDEDALLVADSSLINSAVLRCKGRGLRAAVEQQKDFLFDGDILFLWPQSKRVSVFHHEGGFAHVGW